MVTLDYCSYTQCIQKYLPAKRAMIRRRLNVAPNPHAPREQQLALHKGGLAIPFEPLLVMPEPAGAPATAGGGGIIGVDKIKQVQYRKH